MLQRRFRGGVDGGATNRDHVRLAGGIVEREGVLAGDGRRSLAGVAVVRAVVASRPEDGLPLGGGLLEEQVLSLLEARLALLDGLFAKTPARAHDLVLIGVDDGHVAVDRVVVDPVRARAGAFVDVDVGVRSHCRDVVDVEYRLATAGACRLPTVDGDHAKAAQHGFGGGGTEVAGVERTYVRGGKRFELVQCNVLPGTEVSAPVQPESAVAVGDGVVSEAAVGDGGRLGRRAGSGGPVRVDDLDGARSGDLSRRRTGARSRLTASGWTRSSRPTTAVT